MNQKQFFIKKMIRLAIIIIVAVIIVFVIDFSKKNSGDKNITGYRNIEYFISGKSVKLDPNGPVKYFGNEVITDVNDDKLEDIVFLITQESGGSGTFFYVVVALNTGDGYIGSHAMFIGDRIAPQTTEKGDGRMVIVNYADRAPREPFTSKPTIGKSMWILFDSKSMQFGEVVKDFEGESNL